jgi:hypothetical protein
VSITTLVFILVTEVKMQTIIIDTLPPNIGQYSLIWSFLCPLIGQYSFIWPFLCPLVYYFLTWSAASNFINNCYFFALSFVTNSFKIVIKICYFILALPVNVGRGNVKTKSLKTFLHFIFISII